MVPYLVAMDSRQVAVAELESFLMLAALDSSEKMVEDPVMGGDQVLVCVGLCCSAVLVPGKFDTGRVTLGFCAVLSMKPQPQRTFSCSQQRRTLSASNKGREGLVV